MGHGFCMFYKLVQSIWDGWWAIGICLSGSCNGLGNPKTLILGPWTPTTAWVHGLPYGLVHGLSLSKRFLRSAKFWLLPCANGASYIIIDISIILGNVKNREASWKLLLTGYPLPFCSALWVREPIPGFTICSMEFRKLQMKQANDHKIT